MTGNLDVFLGRRGKDAGHYIRCFDLISVRLTGSSPVEIKLSRDPVLDPQNATAFWTQGEAPAKVILDALAHHLAPTRVRHQHYQIPVMDIYGAIPTLAKMLAVPLTPHYLMSMRVAASLDRIDQQFEELKASGKLKLMNDEWRQNRITKSPVPQRYADFIRMVRFRLIEDLAAQVLANRPQSQTIKSAAANA